MELFFSAGLGNNCDNLKILMTNTNGICGYLKAIQNRLLTKQYVVIEIVQHMMQLIQAMPNEHIYPAYFGYRAPQAYELSVILMNGRVPIFKLFYIL